ncbi:antitoxin [Rhodococcus sp. NPDC058639]|uniref:antitoxin n=1 Tax=Rhodococcus sp. NPDC058639 TaxID=3346570 RepID=UPI003668BF99
MGFMDTVKGLLGKGKGYAAENSDKIDGYIRKAGDVADSKTGGKYSQHIDKAQDAARKRLGTGDAPPGTPPPNPDPVVRPDPESGPGPGHDPGPGPGPGPRPEGGPGPATPSGPTQ